MSLRNRIRALVAVGMLGVLVTAGFLTRDLWYHSLLALARKGDKQQEKEQDAHASRDRITLTAQALATLNPDVRQVRSRGHYWRTLEIPGRVVERPGRSDQGVTTTLPGVVTEVVAVPGEAVAPGQKLFTIRVISEHLQASQRELYQIIHEQKINREEKARLQSISAAIPEIKLLELDYAHRRLKAKEMSYRFELAARGLLPDQIEGIAKGDYVREITIHAPTTSASEKEKIDFVKSEALVPVPKRQKKLLLGMQTLKVHRGDQVEAGQTLCVLSEHEVLYVEGRAFQHELPLIHKAMRKNEPVTMRLTHEETSDWPTIPELRILFVGDDVSPESQTVPVYAELPNNAVERSADGKRFRTWRFRPSQRIFLEVRVDKFEDVLVLPREAVVRQGAENYVFQQDGKAFDRVAVQVLYRDRRNVVISKKGGDLIDNVSAVAHKGAAQLQRALTLQSSSGKIDPHAGHSHD